MLRVDEKARSRAFEIIGGTPCKAAGYRVKIYPLGADTKLKAGEAEKFQTLAKLGFEATTQHQAERETKGSEMAIVVDVGSGAFAGPLEDRPPWCEVGQVIKYQRYAGHEFEDPPGSGEKYRLINDEDILGVYEEKVNG
jgi:co-chaperonin GroES (HSP10)